MRSLALVFAAGLSLSALAQDGKSTPTQPAAPTPPAAPPVPKPIPVPDGPVLNKQEIDGGLLIEDLRIGTGVEATPNCAVVAYYHGTLKNGAIFDSSYDRGEPVPFPLSGVIQGWQKGVPGMKAGGVRRLTVPAAMAYGERSPDPAIPPNSDLIFVIEVVGVLQVEDIVVGTGPTAEPNCLPVTAYVIRDKDGKEIERSETTAPYIWLPGEYTPIQCGVEGMKVGGKRRLTVPKEMNVAPPQLAGKRPQQVPVTIEVELLAVRNDLPGRRR